MKISKGYFINEKVSKTIVKLILAIDKVISDFEQSLWLVLAWLFGLHLNLYETLLFSFVLRMLVW